MLPDEVVQCEEGVCGNESRRRCQWWRKVLNDRLEILDVCDGFGGELPLRIRSGSGRRDNNASHPVDEMDIGLAVVAIVGNGLPHD